MAYSNADQQRLSARGLVQAQGWVTPDQAEIIRRIMAEGRGMIPNFNEEPSFYG